MIVSYSRQPAVALHFAISDTGPGIAPDELDLLFEPFTQTKSGKESQKGTGLGLSISRQFVKLMGGDISIESKVGQGTTFKFDIWIEAAETVEIQNLKSKIQNRVIALAPNQPRYRILIVDDRWDNRQLLVKVLTDIGPPPLGFELREAENGQKAVKIWAEWQPHLIFMDMRMPVMDGYEATKQIKAQLEARNQEPKTAIIALTASTFEEERAVILGAGCDDFLRKPFREADIFEMMHKHIGVRYVYEGVVNSCQPLEISQEPSIPNLLREALVSNLPSDLLTNLEQAAIRLDMDIVDRLINEIRIHNTALADALTALATDYRYGEISALLQEAKENKDE